MEESPLKRQRDEQEEEEEEEEIQVKKQKSYELILSILEEDEDVSTQDLSSLITTLEQEISSSSDESSMNDQISSSEIHPSILEYTHLLEASDDELGIPNNNHSEVIDEHGDSHGVASAEEIDGGDLLLQPMNGGDGFLWEIEDEAANYYALLQSQLFL